MSGKKDKKLAQYSLIPVYPLLKVAEMYGRGAEKYGDRNWEEGYEWSRSYDSIQRHLNAFWGGETWDTEGQHHLASVVFHCFALIEWESRGVGIDNRSSYTALVRSQTVEKESLPIHLSSDQCICGPYECDPDCQCVPPCGCKDHVQT